MGVDVQSLLEMQVLLLSAWLGSALCLPQAAHVSPQAPGLSAHPNPAHTFIAGFQQGAHSNAAHTALRPDCARFQGAVQHKGEVTGAGLLPHLHLLTGKGVGKDGSTRRRMPNEITEVLMVKEPLVDFPM